MQEKIYDEWNKPEWTQVDSSYLQRLEEYLLLYKKTIGFIKEELEDEEFGLENIKKIIGELEDELY